MDRIRYKLTSSKLNGFLLITYIDGHLKSILIEVKPGLNDEQWYHLGSIISSNHSKLSLKALEKLNLTITTTDIEEQEPPNVELVSTHNRVALFCAAYKTAYHINYSATKQDGGKLKNLPISATDYLPLLNIYMQSTEWYLHPKSISNFIGKINEVRLLYKNPQALEKKTNWPIPFDAGYNNMLTDDKRKEYYAALRAAGYRFRDNPGRGGKWEKVEVVV